MHSGLQVTQFWPHARRYHHLPSSNLLGSYHAERVKIDTQMLHRVSLWGRVVMVTPIVSMGKMNLSLAVSI